MSEAERRTYQVSGELSEGSWTFITDYMRALGLTCTPQPSKESDDTTTLPVAEDTATSPIIVQKWEVIQIAHHYGHTPQIAARTWRRLAALYIQKTQPQLYQHFSWYDPTLTRNYPVIFGRLYDRRYRRRSFTDWEDDLRDLHLDTVPALVEQLNIAKAQYAERAALRRILGVGVGPSMGTFLDTLATVALTTSSLEES